MSAVPTLEALEPESNRLYLQRNEQEVFARLLIVRARPSEVWVGRIASRGFATRWVSCSRCKFAGIAQLVEHDLAKVGVASSSLVSRSSFLLR